MLANFFGKSKPITFIVLLALFFSYFFLSILKGVTIDFLFENSMFNYPRFIGLTLIYFFLFNFIVSKNKLTFDNAFAFLFLILCFGLFPTAFFNEKTLINNLLLLLLVRKIYSLQSSKNVFKKLFDAGFWLGVGFIQEPFLIIFCLMLFIAVYIHQKITLQTLLIPILGIITPLFLYFTYCFWQDEMNNFNNLFYWLYDYNFDVYNTLNFMLSIVITGLFFLYSVFVKTPKALAVKNTFRKSWILILMNFLLSVLLLFFIKEKNGSELLYVLFPTTIILANGLELLEKNWAKDIVILTFFLTAFIVYFL